jgi:hypothetical protein
MLTETSVKSIQHLDQHYKHHTVHHNQSCHLHGGSPLHTPKCQSEGIFTSAAARLLPHLKSLHLRGCNNIVRTRIASSIKPHCKQRQCNQTILPLAGQ